MRPNTIRYSLDLYKKLHGGVTQIVDVGTMWLTDFLVDVFPDCHHYLFEPNPEYYKVIPEKYVEINHTLITKAVSNNNITKTIKLPQVQNQESFDAEYITLDQYFNNVPSSTFDNFNTILKIDVDGEEYEIIQGGEEFIKRCGLVIIECNLGLIDTYILEFRRLGFQVWDISGICYYKNQFHQCDVLLINSELFNENIKFRPWDDGPFDINEWIDK